MGHEIDHVHMGHEIDGNSTYLEITGLEQRKVVGWQIMRRSHSWWRHDQDWSTLLQI
jgi:hypothetical protein